MISMSKVHCIRQMAARGISMSDIAKQLQISRTSVYKYLNEKDLSLKPSAIKTRPSILDPYKPIIDEWLLQDMKNWRKQRHSAHRIWQRLKDEYGCEACESTVRKYVAKRRQEIKYADTPSYSELVWHPGDMQVDFGETEVRLHGVKQRVYMFVASFPYSNVGFCQLYYAQNAECVCEGLKAVFEHIQGIPKRIIFDNATGVGRRTSKRIQTTKLFEAFAAHYNFEFTFCNPYSGHEKGNVEAKVGHLRRNLFCPIVATTSLERLNETLFDKCYAICDVCHWKKKIEQHTLFQDDLNALYVLPNKAFNVERFEVFKTNKYAQVTLDELHRYDLPDEYVQSSVTVGFTAFDLNFYSQTGKLIKTSKRNYSDTPTSECDPLLEIARMCKKSRIWQNSRTREMLDKDVVDYIDASDESEKRRCFRIFRQSSAEAGWQATKQAASECIKTTGKIDYASVVVCAQRIRAGIDSLDYSSKPDLNVYAQLTEKE